MDDQDLVDTLQQSKGKSSEITKRVAQSEETEKKLNLARKRYLPVSLANHCTCLDTKFESGLVRQGRKKKISLHFPKPALCLIVNDSKMNVRTYYTAVEF